MQEVSIGDRVMIIDLAKDPSYTGKIGYVRRVDNGTFQAWGTWGEEPLCLYLDTVMIL